MSIDLEYKNKVWALCNKLEVGEVFDIVQNVHPDRRESFIEIVKSHIDCWHSDNTSIELSSDYNRIRKINLK